MAKRIQDAPRAVGFPPIAGDDARVLVLGSMPSVASLAAGQYYAHPRNAFWPIMGRLFDAGPELPYDERAGVLISAKVAVWDVLRECTRPGSLDSAIHVDSECANDFSRFFRQHHRITHVFFNGTKAEAAFRRHVTSSLENVSRPIRYARLPSTSPANAGQRFEEKLAAWQAVRRAVQSAGS
jgi:hypoxanthine-DNA glycosylase